MGTGLKEREKAAAQGGNDDFDDIMSNSFGEDEVEQFGYGNEDEQNPGYNPGDKAYNAQFNGVSDDDDELDGELVEKYGNKKNRRHVDSHGDRVKNNYNSDDDDEPDTGKNIDKAKSAEESGDSGFYSGSRSGEKPTVKLSGNIAKVGPSSAATSILIFGIVGVGGGSVTLASSILVNVKELFHNDRSDATRTNRIMSRATLSSMFNGEEGCKNKVPIECKLSSMSKTRLEAYQAEGFKVKGKEIKANGEETGKTAEDAKNSNATTTGDQDVRYKVTSIEYPDKKGTSNGKEFFAHADTNVDARRVSERGFASRAAFYTNSFFNNYLKRVYGFTNGKKTFPQGDSEDDKKKQDAEFERQSGGGSDEDVRNGRLRSQAETIESEARGKSTLKKASKSGAAGTLLQSYCMAYHFLRTAKGAVEAYQIIQLGKFALMFFQAADEIKDGRGDGSKVRYLADNLTYFDSRKTVDGKANPKYNLSGTDAEAYDIVVHKGTPGLKDFSKKYMLGGSIGKNLQSLTSKFEYIAKAPGLSQALGKDKSQSAKMKTFCRAASGKVMSLLTACVGVAAAITTLTGAETLGLGAIFGLAVDAATCTCTVTDLTDQDKHEQLLDKYLSGDVFEAGCGTVEWAARKVANKLLEWLMSQGLQDKIANALSELNVNASTRGVDSVNAIGSGVGFMLSKAASGYGLRPAKSDNKNKEISEYISHTQPLQDKYNELAKADARLNPLDASNEYSLMGALVRSFNFSALTPKSLYGSVATMSSIFPATVDTVLGVRPVNAGYGAQPSTAADGSGGRYETCDNEGLRTIGAAGDTFCSAVGVTPTEELTTIEEVAYKPGSKKFLELLNWMRAKQEQPEGGSKNSGTADSGDCANLDGSDDKDCKNSKLASIDDNGKPIPESQYSKYLKYCTDLREAQWGYQNEQYEQGSDRDQDWYSGVQCLKDTQMMRNFRLWTGVCLAIGTFDSVANCYTDQAPASTSECAGGGNKAIYTCALKYDKYRYLWGGGHGDVANAQAWISDFNAGKIPEYTQILDCSGLVRMAYVEAMGIEDRAYHAPEEYGSSKNWEKIDLKDAEQGDIITQDGHVAIVESNDKNGTFKIFHASTEYGPPEDNITHGSVSYGDVIAAYRAKKG